MTYVWIAIGWFGLSIVDVAIFHLWLTGALARGLSLARVTAWVRAVRNSMVALAALCAFGLFAGALFMRMVP